MKTLILSVVLTIFCAASLDAQIRKIPSDVTDSFAYRYPHAEKVEWSDRLTSFEAGFTLNGVEMKAGFSSDGDWKYTEKTLTFDDLNPDVKDGFAKSKYADWTKGSVTEIRTPDKPLQYKVYAEKSAPFQKKYLYFDVSGKLLREAITL